MYLVNATPINCLLNFYETLHSCSTQPADVHEGIPLLSKIPKFEHHNIAIVFIDKQLIITFLTFEVIKSNQ
jgi:hypothetical protein